MTIVLVGFVLLYFILVLITPGKYKINYKNALTSLMSTSIGWFSYLIYSHYSFPQFAINLLPPYPDITAGVAHSTSGSKAATGFEQYIDVLTKRWEPWWVYFILSFPLLLYTAISLAIWIHQSRNIIQYKNEPTPTYILATTGGILGLVVLTASLAGFSATNLVMRYLVYAMPIFTLLIITEIDIEISTTSINIHDVLTIIIILSVVVGMITTPIKTSREPELQEVRFNIYDTELEHALDWSASYASEKVSVPYRGAAQAVFYSEFQNFRPLKSLPITGYSTNTTMRRNHTAFQRPSDIIYSNKIITIQKRDHFTNT
jgi:hypothetical protein